LIVLSLLWWNVGSNIFDIFINAFIDDLFSDDGVEKDIKLDNHLF